MNVTDKIQITKKNNMNGYELSRQWFDWSFENPEKVSPNHTALYFFAIEHCNRLGWRKKFGFPTEMAKDAIGIKSYNTYIKTLNDLVEWGFVEMLERSKNQYSSNIIALSNFDKALDNALDNALDKAIVKHITKQDESNIQSNSESISSIDKPLTKNQEPLTTKPQTTNIFFFEKSLVDYGFKKNLVSDWLKVRKTKKSTNTKTAFDSFIKEIESRSCDINEMLEIAVKNSWSGFKHEWVDNLKKQSQNGATKSTSEIIAGITTSQAAREFVESRRPAKG